MGVLKCLQLHWVIWKNVLLLYAHNESYMWFTLFISTGAEVLSHSSLVRDTDTGIKTTILTFLTKYYISGSSKTNVKCAIWNATLNTCSCFLLYIKKKHARNVPRIWPWWCIDLMVSGTYAFIKWMSCQLQVQYVIWIGGVRHQPIDALYDCSGGLSDWEVIHRPCLWLRAWECGWTRHSWSCPSCQ